ncbi:MAG: PAS domain S-box protein [Deltaproteobacteria bacterium]|nr:PAS domain S-box protein [Deltaproteobacteria bacterium]
MHELQRRGHQVASHVVQSASALKAALRQEWDLITCDWALPGFSAPAALKIVGEHGVDAPVIVVSSQVTEDVTLTAMKAGACDAVSKRNLARLGSAVEHELRAADERRACRRVEAALKASETRYRRLFETAEDGIFILDAESGGIIDVNPFLLELLGYTREQVVGKQLWELGAFRDIAANQGALRDLQTKEYIRYEHLPLESEDGRRTDVEVVGNAYQENGSRVIQCNVRTITERKRAEQEIGALNAELERRVQERTAQAEAINNEFEAFRHSISHDLRAPLRLIEDFSKLLREEHAGQLDSQGRHCVDQVQAGARRIEQLIADLLGFSRTA